MSIFTDRLSSLLEKNNMTQRELAERIGVTTATLCRYVSGERQPKSDTVANIAMQSFKRNGASQSWFPKSWTEKDIKRAGEHVAGLKGNRRVADGKTIYGVYKGVRVGVKRTNGKIATVFPYSDQSSVTRRKRK